MNFLWMYFFSKRKKNQKSSTILYQKETTRFKFPHVRIRIIKLINASVKKHIFQSLHINFVALKKKERKVINYKVERILREKLEAIEADGVYRKS